MKIRQADDNTTLLTFSDLFLILKRSKTKLLVFTLGFASLAGLFALSTTPLYKSEATFREKAHGTSPEVNRTINLVLGGADSNENIAVSVMKSRKIREEAIHLLAIQASIKKDKVNFPLFRNISNNLKIELAYWRNSKEPVIKDLDESLTVSSVNYTGEVPLNLKIKFTSDENYVAYDKKGEEIGIGELDHPFSTPFYTFTITRLRHKSLNSENLKLDREQERLASSEPLKNSTFKLLINPLTLVAKNLTSCFACDTDSKDKSLIKLSFNYPKRQIANAYLDSIMSLYQDYLKTEHRVVANQHLAYLNQRREETTDRLKSMMEEHAHALSSSMATIDFLFQTQQSHTQKLMLLDMELHKLTQAKEAGLIFKDRYLIEGGDTLSINQILAEIRSHRQQSDSIEIALRNTEFNPQTSKRAFADQSTELEEIKATREEAKNLLFSLQNNKTSAPLTLLSQDKYRVNDWQHKIKEKELAFQEALPALKTYTQTCLTECHRNFNAYLNNLIHILAVEEKVIEERLTHQQGPLQEFQGIDLPTANQLYIHYSQTLNEIEAQHLHYAFILDQLKDPQFEISSLSSVLEDTVSKEIITRASNLVLMVKDQDNRSQREIDRLKVEISQQKRFLSLHLAQMMQLLNLRKNLYLDKILAIQNTQLELIQQKISVLEQHLRDLIDTRISTIQQEKTAIAYQQQVIQQEMTKMPAKWASEKLVDQQLEISRKVMEEITKSVEQKNISAQLDVSRSAPLDYAFSPIHPISSYPLFFALLGGLSGLMGYSSFILGRSIIKGIPATLDNLKFSDQHVSGTLTDQSVPPTFNQLPIQDLDTLRRLSHYFFPNENFSTLGQLVLLLIGNGKDYSTNLATLLSKQGQRVLIIPLSFDSFKDTSTGLLQFLEGQIDMPHIQQDKYYDFIIPGGLSSQANELLSSIRFQTYLKEVSQKYHHILLVSKANLLSGEAEGLAKRFNHVAISVTEERLHDLTPFIEIITTKPEGAKLSFVFSPKRLKS